MWLIASALRRPISVLVAVAYIGSAAFRHPSDPPNVVWTMADRGPNIACSDMKKIAKIDFPACKEVKNGRVYPTPSYTPSIYRVILMEDGTFRVTDVPSNSIH